MSKIEDISLEISDKLAAEMNFLVVDAEYKKENGSRILRIYIDKKGGVDLDDCENFSHALEEILDDKNLIDEAYSLEISSPGLERQLKKEREFLYYLGRRVRVKLYKEMDGKKEFDGVLKDYKEKLLYIEVNGKIIAVNPKDAAYIKLYFEF